MIVKLLAGRHAEHRPGDTFEVPDGMQFFYEHPQRFEIVQPLTGFGATIEAPEALPVPTSHVQRRK